MNVQETTSAVIEASAVPVVPMPCAVHRLNLKDFLVRQEGSFVSVDFIKKDGSPRTLVGRLGVRRHLKGGTNKVATMGRPYLVMYDVQKAGYRTVNLETVSAVSAQHKRYVVIS